MIRRGFVPGWVVVLCGACGAAPGPAPFTGDNNTGVLTGPPVGAGLVSNDLLRKPVTVSVAGASMAFSVGPGFAVRSSATTETTLVLIEVSNAAKTGRCFIKASGFDLRDSGGATLKSSQLTYVQGSVGDLGSPQRPLLTDTCLAPGERGVLVVLFTSSGEPLFSRADSVVFRWEDSSATRPFMPRPRLAPTAYGVTSTGAVTVAFSNTGSGEALMSEHFSRFVLLDAEGRPLFSGFLTERTSPAGGLVPVGSEGSVEGGPAASGYLGAATALRAFLDFDMPTPNALLGETMEGAGSDPQRHAAWNAEQLRRELTAVSRERGPEASGPP